MDRETNAEVLEIISEGKLLWKNIVRRRNEWIGLIMKHEGLLKQKRKDYRRKSRIERTIGKEQD